MRVTRFSNLIAALCLLVAAPAHAQDCSQSLRGIIESLGQAKLNPQRAPDVGDYVRIGSTKDRELSLRSVSSPGETFDLEGFELPYMGKIVGNSDSDHWIVEVSSVDDGIGPMQVKVPKANTFSLPLDTRLLMQKADDLASARPLPRVASEVRVRNGSGKIVTGKVQSVTDDGVCTVTLPDKTTVQVKADKVFEMTDGALPESTHFVSDAIPSQLASAVDGPFVKALDAAAATESRLEFKHLSSRDKLQFLMDYTRSFIKPAKIATKADRAGLGQMDAIVCAGVGACRHLTQFLGTLCNEAGYHTRLVLRRTSAKGPGHAWLEVTMKGERGEPVTWIVDPAADVPPMTLADAKAMATRDPESNAATWYTHSERETVEPTR